MAIRRSLGYGVALALLSVKSMAAGSFSFVPTAGEWASWPEFCRARYVSTSGGSASEYANAVPQEIQQKWKTKLGRPFITIHHYCAGMAWLQRAQFETDTKKRQDALRKARNEALFTFERVDQDHPIYGEIATHMGAVARASGDAAAASKYFDLAIRTHPEYAGGYQGYSLVLQDKGDLAGARDILEKGDEATGGESAEIHYFLGLTLVKLKDFENARLHAKRAYEIGYPLPGLARQLAAAGYPLN